MENPKDSFPILVIGRGIVGCSVAFELASRGFPVVLIGPGRKVQREAGAGTLAAHGLCSTRGSLTARVPLFAAKMDAAKTIWSWLARLEEVSGRSIPRIQGAMYQPFSDDSQYHDVRRRTFRQLYTGVYRFRLVAAKDALAPKFGREAIGAFHFYDDVWFDPEAVLDALEAGIEKLGGRTVTAKLLSLSADKDGLSVHLKLDCGDEASWRAAEVVLAAGTASGPLLKSSGAKEILAQGKAIAGHSLQMPLEQAVPVSYGLYLGKHRAFMDNRRVVFGSTAISLRSDGRDDWGQAQLESERELVLAFQKYFSMPIVGCTMRWGCRYAVPDRMPVLGELPFHDHRILIATAFYRNGLQLAHVAARCLSGLISKTASVQDQFFLRAFSPKRLI